MESDNLPRINSEVATLVNVKNGEIKYSKSISKLGDEIPWKKLSEDLKFPKNMMEKKSWFNNERHWNYWYCTVVVWNIKLIRKFMAEQESPANINYIQTGIIIPRLRVLKTLFSMDMKQNINW